MYYDGAETGRDPDQVRPRLFISDAETAEDRNVLLRHNVSHIVNLCGSETPYPEEFTYLTFGNIMDCPKQDILSHLGRCIAFINRGLDSGTGVLVHCHAGVSRSATVVIAFLMHSESLSVDEALRELRKVRPCVQPNQGFIVQLRRFAELGCNIQRDVKLARRMELLSLSCQMRAGAIDRSLLVGDPANVDLGLNAQQLPFRCRRCCRKLFFDGHLLEHQPTMNDGCQHGVGPFRSRCEAFVEPLEWMLPLFADGKLSGVLTCPNPRCNVEIGRWSAGESTCQACSACFSPSVVIDKKKVVK